MFLPIYFVCLDYISKPIGPYLYTKKTGQVGVGLAYQCSVETCIFAMFPLSVLCYIFIYAPSLILSLKVDEVSKGKVDGVT